jgi:hypothetical protein
MKKGTQAVFRARQSGHSPATGVAQTIDAQRRNVTRALRGTLPTDELR